MKLILNNTEDLKSFIINYLDTKGRIKAELLSKIINRISKNEINFKIGIKEIIKCLFSMKTERLIEIIIPEVFLVTWEKVGLKNMRFLKDGSYLVRKFSNFEEESFISNNENEYFFDSRRLDFNEDINTSEWMNRLIYLIEKVHDFLYKIIIYKPQNSEPLNIYEPFQENYKIKFLDFNPDSKINEINKIEVSLEQQKENLEVLQVYRSKHMCFYITLIEAIQKVIEYLQINTHLLNHQIILQDYMRKFAYNCILFVRSDYIEINEPNPYRWETFFKFFNIPIKILIYDFRSINFYGKVFDSFGQLKYCIFIQSDKKEIIEKLIRLGYKEFSTENYSDKIAIGLDVEFYFPCSTIEHLYFLTKYFCYYHLFILFFHSFDFIEKFRPDIKFTNSEKNLYKVFAPVMQSLFGIEEPKVLNNLIFKYYSYNPDELEIIYNNFLLKNAKIIEKKLISYFLIRTSNNASNKIERFKYTN